MKSNTMATLQQYILSRRKYHIILLDMLVNIFSYTLDKRVQKLGSDQMECYSEVWMYGEEQKQRSG